MPSVRQLLLRRGWFPKDDCELGLARLAHILESIARPVTFRRVEKESGFDMVGKAGKAALAVYIGPYFEVEFAHRPEPIGDVDFDLGGINRLVIGVSNGEVGGTGADAGID